MNVSGKILLAGIGLAASVLVSTMPASAQWGRGYDRGDRYERGYDRRDNGRWDNRGQRRAIQNQREAQRRAIQAQREAQRRGPMRGGGFGRGGAGPNPYGPGGGVTVAPGPYGGYAVPTGPTNPGNN